MLIGIVGAIKNLIRCGLNLCPCGATSGEVIPLRHWGYGYNRLFGSLVTLYVGYMKKFSLARCQLMDGLN